MKISFNRTAEPKEKPDLNLIGFGTHTTDHMFLVEFSKEKGWYNARISPYAKLEIDPSAMALHYAVSIFEGLKVYKQKGGGLAAFRPLENALRLNRSAQLMAMPKLPTSLFLDGLKRLVEIDQSWVPERDGYALYVRPVMISTQATLGVSKSSEFLFYIILTPSPPYYKKGAIGFNLLASPALSRSEGYSVASSKTAGNYGKLVPPQESAKSDGFDNILWLGGKNHNYIEEAGITNVFVVKHDKVITPPLNGQILSGITRDSVIELLKERNIIVKQHDIDIETLCTEIENGSATEAFLTGTATVIAPVRSIYFNDSEFLFKTAPKLATSLYQELVDIQSGNIEDKFGWRYPLCEPNL